MELIDRKKAIKAIMDLPNCPNGFSDMYDKARIIATLEVTTVDAVEVVRCKDCRFFSATWDGFGFCKKLPRVMMREYDYCSDGKRREE